MSDSMTMPEPPAGWRQVAPADCVGLPTISVGYMNELTRMATEAGLSIGAGDTVTARYQKVDGEWHPIPDTVEVQHSAAAVSGEAEEGR